MDGGGEGEGCGGETATRHWIVEIMSMNLSPTNHWPFELQIP